MDSRKRNAAAAVSDTNHPTPKRIKSDSLLLTHGETPETTTDLGLKFLEHIKRTQDKNKRLVATNFLTLPDKRLYPDYYDTIKLPIALDTIENKLRRREFPNLSALESYFKRMITNAKTYNVNSSEIWQDAERLRKVVSGYMKENNPEYLLNSSYVAHPTPVPGQLPIEEDHDSDLDAEGEPDFEEPVSQPVVKPTPDRVIAAGKPRGRPRGSVNKVASVTKVNGQRSSTTPVSESRYTGRGYAGLTYQQAQEKILYDLQEETDEAKDLKFEVFKTLPPKSLKDYWKVIPNPTSLRKLIKDVKNGVKEGSTPFRTWSSYEDEVSLLWKNAFHYNEDGSEISELAKELQKSFYARLAEAKQEVPEPGGGPKIKLKLGSGIASETTGGPQKITLRMPGIASPAVSPAPPTWNDPNFAATNGAAMNGVQKQQPRQLFATSQSSTPAPYGGTPSRAMSLSAPIASPGLPQFKNEEVARPSPALSSATMHHPIQNGPSQSFLSNPQLGNLMPPPRTPAFPQSFPGSQSTNVYGHNPSSGGYGQGQDPLQSKWRAPGKDDSDALITKVTISTHPDLNIARHFKMDVLPSPTMAHQSVTFNLPSTHYYIQVAPVVSPHVINRQHKLFLTVNNQRLQSMPKIQGGVVDRESQVFVARLVPGVNRIELEIIAALPKGAAKGVNGSDVELEKFNIFANLLK